MHLADCFLELFTYIRLLTGSQEMAAVDYDTVRNDITVLIDRMDDRADQLGVSEKSYSDARFAVFAWADESVLVSSWSGTRDWLKHPLQREFYDTANGGEEFFERLEIMLRGGEGPVDKSIFADLDSEETPADSSEAYSNELSEVLEVYALCLSMGFTGMYFSESGEAKLEDLRRDCLQKISGGAVMNGETAFPQSYGTEKPAPRKCCYGRVFDPIALVFIILSLLVVAGMFVAYRELLEESIKLWFG